MDVALIVVSLYGYWSMRQYGRIFTFGGGDPVKNPLMLLLPALFVLAFSLILVRIFRPLLERLGRLRENHQDVSIFVAVRYVAWMSLYRSRLVLMLVMTLALGTFSASMARTLEENYIASARYQIGADVALDEWAEYDPRYREYRYLPVEEHLDVPPVKAGSRVLALPAQATSPRTAAPGSMKWADANLLAIDRYTFPQVAWWRRDFAPDSLGALMNALAHREDGVRVSRSLLANYPTDIGDEVRILVDQTPVNFVIVGMIDYFPSLYPKDDGHLFVVNLDYILQRVESYPYDVWLSLEDGASVDEVVRMLRDRGFSIPKVDNSRSLIDTFRRESSHVAMVGLLSTGLGISAFLTALGFILFSIVSLKARAIQLGLLRVLGLSLRQLILLVASEQAFVITLGAGLGTALGLVASRLFVPFLQVGTELSDIIPPFTIVSVWSELGKLYLASGLALIAGGAVAVRALLRLKAHEAIKLGSEQI